MPDREICLRAMASRDARFDGWFFVAVSTTRIYCRPSCPATTPRPENVRFFPTAAAAQGAGFRACLRCRPDASPGSPEWRLRGDLTGRAMQLIADGVVDREGVDGLARRLACSPRHLRRRLTEELGAGPIGLARAQRAQTARVLIETTDLPFGEVAFAAGFASLRQFNETVRSVFARTPTELRRRSRRAGAPPHLGAIALRLPYREPYDTPWTLGFLADRAVPGVEEVVGGTYRRTLALPHGIGVVELTPRDGHVSCVLRLCDLRDLAAAVARCRALFDLDADPHAVDAVLGEDELLAPLVRRSPGRRVPGAVDGAELAVRAVVGQQVAVGSARTLLGRVAAELGEPLTEPDGSLCRVFPSAEGLAAADPSILPLTGRRRATVQALASAVAGGRLVLDAGADRDEVRRRLLELPGVGPWTAAYVLMRALADTDAFLPSDHGVLQALRLTGRAAGPVLAEGMADRWRPWRAYAVQHLWGMGSREG